jgi:signal transduction histidine kinase
VKLKAVPKALAPALAEAAGSLSEQLLAFLGRLAALLQPESGWLEMRFLEQLETLGFEPRQRAALVYLTAGAAARVLGSGGSPAQFLEQVEYHGRRLAKLNLTPSDIVIALREYEDLLAPLLKRKNPAESANFEWVREQLQFYVMLALNNAYYQVREEETQAFFEMFWSELESDSLDDLLDRFLSILARFSRADAAQWYLVERPRSGYDAVGTQQQPVLVRRASLRGDLLSAGILRDSPAQLSLDQALELNLGVPACFGLEGARPGRTVAGVRALDASWSASFRHCWSVPLMTNGELAGVIQFAFAKNYEWLPREQELLTAAAERCLKAVEKTQLVMDLAERERQLRLLAERMMHVEEVERRRISRELHDQTGQDLLCIRLQLEMVEAELPKAARARVAGIRDLTERTILEIRRLIAALSPAVLEQLGLAPALRQLMMRHSEIHPWKIRLQVPELETLPKQLEVIVYRLVQECFNNIAKHSRCASVNISLRAADGVLRLIVEDDGVGFNVEEAFRKTGSFGLAGIRERVALLGGRCDITSRQRSGVRAGKAGPAGRGAAKPLKASKPQKSGTKITIELPIPAEQAVSGADMKKRSEQRRRASRLREAIATAGAESTSPAVAGTGSYRAQTTERRHRDSRLRPVPVSG